MLNRWPQENKPDLPLPYTTITLNTNYHGCPHQDPNEGPTYMAVVGDYNGGQPRVWPRDTRRECATALNPAHAQD
eukprot:12931624-Prorocentrum_lima.AAC.1